MSELLVFYGIPSALPDTKTSEYWNRLKTIVLVWLSEQRHDKPNKMSVRPAKTQISLGIRPVWSGSSLSAWRNLGSLATHWAHSEDWSDWADAQADLRLRWAHTHCVCFVMSRLISNLRNITSNANQIRQKQTAKFFKQYWCQKNAKFLTKWINIEIWLCKLVQ